MLGNKDFYFQLLAKLRWKKHETTKLISVLKVLKLLLCEVFDNAEDRD